MLVCSCLVVIGHVFKPLRTSIINMDVRVSVDREKVRITPEDIDRVKRILSRDTRFVREFYGIEPKITEVRLVDDNEFDRVSKEVSDDVLLLNTNLLDKEISIKAVLATHALRGYPVYQRMSTIEERLSKRKIFKMALTLYEEGYDLFGEISEFIPVHVYVTEWDGEIAFTMKNRTLEEYTTYSLTYLGLIGLPDYSDVVIDLPPSLPIDEENDQDMFLVTLPLVLYQVFGPYTNQVLSVNEGLRMDLLTIGVKFVYNMFFQLDEVSSTRDLFNLLGKYPPTTYTQLMYPQAYKQRLGNK